MQYPGLFFKTAFGATKLHEVVKITITSGHISAKPIANPAFILVQIKTVLLTNLSDGGGEP